MTRKEPDRLDFGAWAVMTLSPRLESILVTAIVALVIAMIALGAEHHLAVMS